MFHTSKKESLCKPTTCNFFWLCTKEGLPSSPHSSEFCKLSGVRRTLKKHRNIIYHVDFFFFTSHFWTDSAANSGRRKSFSWYNLVGRQRETRAHWGDAGLPKKTSKSNRHPSSTYTGCDLLQRLHWCLHECILTISAAGRARAGKLARKLPIRGTEGLHSTTTLWIHVFTQANSNGFWIFRLAHLQHGQNRNRDMNSLLSYVCVYTSRDLLRSEVWWAYV